MDTISFDGFFICKLERTNDIKKTCAVSTLKKLKILKLENAYLLYLSFWLKLFIHQNLKFSNILMKLQPLSEGFKKKIVFNITLIMNTFLSKNIIQTI